ncbi:hypothetical protein SS50377_22730 [Spironucleus salmonicida]|uniref:Uncharacterized protein n=1 Tax=Spironucleus salmonicida TaxID=348837 RepID=V6LKG1_9EUKA|nr:hypothetical protein SS50377_22730 [Spironucleus salmonicida]|eukprot:EST44206.1 Hypothetical protein SS50377_16014 [Spironucleus salmonicida]
MLLDAPGISSQLQPPKRHLKPYLHAGKVSTPSPQLPTSPLLALPEINKNFAPTKPQLTKIVQQQQSKHNLIARNIENLRKLEAKMQNRRQILSQKYEISRILDFESDERQLKDRIQRDLQLSKIAFERQKGAERKGNRNGKGAKNEAKFVSQLIQQNSSESESVETEEIQAPRDEILPFSSKNDEISQNSTNLQVEGKNQSGKSKIQSGKQFFPENKFFTDITELISGLGKRVSGVLAERAFALAGRDGTLGNETFKALVFVLENGRFGLKKLPPAPAAQDANMLKLQLYREFRYISRRAIRNAVEIFSGSENFEVSKIFEILRFCPFGVEKIRKGTDITNFGPEMVQNESASWFHFAVQRKGDNVIFQRMLLALGRAVAGDDVARIERAIAGRPVRFGE